VLVAASFRGGAVIAGAPADGDISAVQIVRVP
jgi:hypothetical protein